ncbi:LysR family substrate-binding domain-containing protein [Streptomyces koyangensis]|uniref:LysR family substrate-binding domain-containing protein n=1 Tax=Streptomyces koyangensis TaxID=188770 RepID=UPI003C2D04C9
MAAHWAELCQAPCTRTKAVRTRASWRSAGAVESIPAIPCGPVPSGHGKIRQARRRYPGGSRAGRRRREGRGRWRHGACGTRRDPLPGVLRRFSRERPDVRMELQEMASSRSSVALAGGELDVAVTLGRPRGIGAERLVSVPVGHDHLVAVVGSGHPYAGLRSVAVAQLLHQPLIVASGEDKPAVAAGLRALLGEGSPALSSATVARDVHTVIGLAACAGGVGLGPSRMLAAPRPGTWFCEVTPRTPLPDLALPFPPRGSLPRFGRLLRRSSRQLPGRRRLSGPPTRAPH